MVKEFNDPMAKAMHELIDHCVENDKRIDEILHELQRLGCRLEGEDAERLDAGQLNKMVD